MNLCASAELEALGSHVGCPLWKHEVCLDAAESRKLLYMCVCVFSALLLLPAVYPVCTLSWRVTLAGRCGFIFCSVSHSAFWLICVSFLCPFYFIQFILTSVSLSDSLLFIRRSGRCRFHSSSLAAGALSMFVLSSAYIFFPVLAFMAEQLHECSNEKFHGKLSFGHNRPTINFQSVPSLIYELICEFDVCFVD